MARVDRVEVWTSDVGCWVIGWRKLIIVGRLILTRPAIHRRNNQRQKIVLIHFEMKTILKKYETMPNREKSKQQNLEHRESNPGRQSDSLECYCSYAMKWRFCFKWNGVLFLYEMAVFVFRMERRFCMIVVFYFCKSRHFVWLLQRHFIQK